MTSMNSLDSVLRAGLDAAAHSGPTQVEGEKLADARAQVLQGTVATKPLLLQPDNDHFAPGDGSDPNDTDDARLTRALRSLAERFQAGQAAQAAVADEPSATAAVGSTTAEETGRQLAYIGQWVGATTFGSQPAPAPTPPPAVPPPSGSGSTGGSGSGTNNGGTNNGNGYGRTK